MSSKNKKQFGVWMDSHHATVVGNIEQSEFTVLGHITNAGPGSNSSENASNNLEQTMTAKFFKEITALMQNVDDLHVTGTGQIQEQFVHYLADTPQYKNVNAQESTSNKMSDESLVEFISAKFN